MHIYGCLLLTVISSHVFAQTVKQEDAAGEGPLGVEPTVLLHGKWIKVSPTSVSPARPLNAFPARVPSAMMQGTTHPAVLLLVTVGIDGHVDDIKVVRPATKELDKIAIRTASRWKFEPAQYMNQPVGMRILVEVDFKAGY
jgi:TonB family protein